ncbi:hypothetical protein [Terrarubrum flagellatum]|uniref:hypothetical protein n=1 Tax=Terrirubrum flagellatum TaxID=2895980 RepID=UPI003144DF7C
MPSKTAALLALPCFLLSSCAERHPYNTVEVAKTSMRGLSEQDVRMCAGFPSKTFDSGKTSVWSYEMEQRSGGVTLGAPVMFGIANTSLSLSSNGYCRVQFLFVDGKVDQVSYAGDSDTPRGKDTLCTPVVSGCVGYVQEKQR